MSTIWEILEGYLDQVEKPARYIGLEQGAQNRLMRKQMLHGYSHILTFMKWVFLTGIANSLRNP